MRKQILVKYWSNDIFRIYFCHVDCYGQSYFANRAADRIQISHIETIVLWNSWTRQFTAEVNCWNVLIQATTHCLPVIITCAKMPPNKGVLWNNYYTKIQFIYLLWFMKGYSRWWQWLESLWGRCVLGRGPSHILSAHTYWWVQWAGQCKSRCTWNWWQPRGSEGVSGHLAVEDSKQFVGMNRWIHSWNQCRDYSTLIDVNTKFFY